MRLRPGDAVWVRWEDAFTDDAEQVYVFRGRVLNPLARDDGITELPAYYLAHDATWLYLAWFSYPTATGSTDSNSRWGGTFRVPRALVREVRRWQVGARVTLRDPA